ncbi:MAG: hypothetical protein K2N05_11370 [Muribaculaceae bacterium]|nr:hypothetical protein [Muribaculaceae bacterium]
MKRLSYYLFTFLGLMTGLLSGCTDEIDYKVNPADDIPDGIVLRIPDTKGLVEAMGTRSETAEITDQEGTINNIYLLAYADGKDPIRIDLSKVEEQKETTDNAHGDDNGNYKGYKEYDLTKDFKGKSGLWRFYVVANLDQYTSADLMSISEDDLKDLQLNFFSGTAPNKTYELTLANGLPMACGPDKIMAKTTKTGSLSVQSGGVMLSDNSNALIHADLEFLCSKVRYTLFFDNTSKDFSKTIFDGLTFNLDQVWANSVFDGTTKITGTADAINKNDLINLPSGEYKYPSNADSYPGDDDKFKSLEAKEGTPYAQRAFQGTFYLPENLKSGDDMTTLVFKGHAGYQVTEGDGTNKQVSQNQGATLSYNLPLLPKGVDGSTALKRGQAYDIAARITGVESIELTGFIAQPFTTERLVYSLLPPASLHVYETSIAVKGGEMTELKYESSAPVSFQTPYYNNDKTKPIYDFDTSTAGVIKIGVHPSITSDLFDKILADDQISKYNYFYIDCGNIHKKIDVTPLQLESYLTVSEKEITIDAKSKIASASYNGLYPIKIKTNEKKVRLSSDNWTGTTQDCLWLVNSNNEAIKLWSGENPANDIDITLTDDDNGEIILLVKYDRVNDGVDFWKYDRGFSFSVSAPDNDNLETCNVAVNTLPNNDNYLIYFKDNSNWDNCHVYIYQCLELPASGVPATKNFRLNDGTLTNADGCLTLASATVGYSEYNNEGTVDGAGTSAALQYSLTGAIAFKGWDYGTANDDNKNMLSVDSLKNGCFYKGFFMFKGSKHTNNSWNPKYSTNRYFKGDEADFCNAHRKELRDKTNTSCGCELSSDGKLKSGYNNLWPGIKMIKVNLGTASKPDWWWRFELSSVATPGKALIMFSNGHSEYNGMDRYPAKNENGIPLFNFPNRIGYIEKDGSFRPTRVAESGSGNVTNQNVTLTLYVENTCDLNASTNPDIYLWGSGGDLKSWDNKDSMDYYKKSSYNHNVYKFTVTASKTKLENMIVRFGNDNAKTKEYYDLKNDIGNSTDVTLSYYVEKSGNDYILKSLGTGNSWP